MLWKARSAGRVTTRLAATTGKKRFRGPARTEDAVLTTTSALARAHAGWMAPPVAGWCAPARKLALSVGERRGSAVTPAFPLRPLMRNVSEAWHHDDHGGSSAWPRWWLTSPRILSEHASAGPRRDRGHLEERPDDFRQPVRGVAGVYPGGGCRWSAQLVTGQAHRGHDVAARLVRLDDAALVGPALVAEPTLVGPGRAPAGAEARTEGSFARRLPRSAQLADRGRRARAVPQRLQVKDTPRRMPSVAEDLEDDVGGRRHQLQVEPVGGVPRPRAIGTLPAGQARTAHTDRPLSRKDVP